jgi:transposase-like protein
MRLGETDCGGYNAAAENTDLRESNQKIPRRRLGKGVNKSIYEAGYQRHACPDCGSGKRVDA